MPSFLRALAIWFVLQCSMPGYEREGSGFFRGQIHFFHPALKGLRKGDSVAAAHWCYGGAAKLDLLPTTSIEDAISTMEQVLAASISPADHERTGELALQKTLQLIIDATRSRRPEPLTLWSWPSALTLKPGTQVLHW
jgi:hypothetical protein